MEGKYVPCNNCYADDAVELFPAGKAQIHRIVKCRKCGLMYANPQLDNVTDVEKDYTLSRNDDEDAALTVSQKFTLQHQQYLQKQFLQLKDYREILDFTEKGNKGIFLEVGSFAGTFLYEAKKRGWSVVGVEPLELPALYSEELGVPVIRSYFEEADIPAQSLEVIVATHVIEHVPDPSRFFDKAYQSLKPGGKLVLETPTYDSFAFSFFRHRERSIRCSGHLYFFTLRSLKRLAEKGGFSVVKQQKVGRTLTLDRLFYNFGVITGMENFFSRMSNLLTTKKFTMRLNMHDMQRIYCEKK